MLQIISYVCIFLLLLMLVVFLESIRECRKIHISEYTVLSERLPDNFSGCKFVLLADIHNRCFGKDNSRLLQAIENCSPDYILIAGDMFVCKPRHYDKNLRTAAFVSRLAALAPVYYSMGNHETGIQAGVHNTEGMWKELLHELDEENNSNLFLLDNKSLFIERGGQKIRICGLSLERTYFRRFVVEPLDKKQVAALSENGSDFVLLMAHHPDYFPVYAASGADLTVAGHNHGGVVRLPFFGGVISPRFHLFPTYDKGIYKKDDKTMIVSAGLGVHSISVRFNNLPEIVLIRLQNTEK